MERPAVEQGADTQLFCKVAVTTPFEGKAKVTLLGLPAKVTTQVIEITKDTKEIAFPIDADKTSPAGKHNAVRQVVIDRGGELITGNTGGTRTAHRRAAAAEGRGGTPPPTPNPVAPKTPARPTAAEPPRSG